MKHKLLAASAIALWPIAGLSAQTQPTVVHVDPQKSDEQASAASSSAPVGVEDIIVTASRRAETAQSTAIPVSVVSGEDLLKRGVVAPEDLNKTVPGLAISPNGAQTQVYLRGIGTFSFGSFADQAVAVNVDQVFYPFSQEIPGSFYDLQRIEVLKGPQGTLYGRNAAAGAINLITNRPTFNRTADISLETGNYGLIKTTAAVNLPLSETLALRGAFNIVHRDGYLSDGYNDEKTEAGRLRLLYQPSSTFSVLLGADFSHLGGRGAANVPLPRVNGGNPWEGPSTPLGNSYITAFEQSPVIQLITLGKGVRQTDRSGFQNTKVWGVNADIEADLSFATLSVIPAYRHLENTSRIFFGVVADEVDRGHHQSLEVRLASSPGDRFKWQFGGYYFESKIFSSVDVDVSFVRQILSPTYRTRNFAGFGDATYSVTDSFRLTGGGRYTTERRSQDGGAVTFTPFPPPTTTVAFDFPGQKTFSNFSYKAGAEYDLAQRSLLYATLSTGFKAGGFNYDIAPNVYQPEKLTAYTIGSKNRFFGNRLQANLEVFYWKYRNHQEIFQQVLNASSLIGTQATAPKTINIGKSTLKGAELALEYAPTQNDRLSAQVAYLDATFDTFIFDTPSGFAPNPPPGIPGTYTSCLVTTPSPTGVAGRSQVDCSGKPFTRAPKWQIQLGYEHSFQLANGGKITAGVESQFSSSYFLSVDYIDAGRQNAYNLTDLNIAYTAPEGRWSIAGFVRNIGDTAVYTGGVQQVIAPGTIYASIRAPRTYGATLRARFR